MSENATHTYEGLFLFPQSAGADLGGADAGEKAVPEAIDKGGACSCQVGRTAAAAAARIRDALPPE